MSSVFTSTFGGSAVSPADVAFAEYSFGANLTLFWPAFAAGNPDVAARFMRLTATATSLNVSLAEADLVSNGQDVIIFNAGSNTFNVVDFNGGAIATIATGQAYYIILRDNSTTAGVWQTIQFGVGTGSASAAALAGAGLLAAAGLLNVNFDSTLVSTSYNLTVAQRAILQVWTGGSGTITLPAASSVGDGFFFSLANNGSGNVTVATTGGDLIDDAATSVFAQTQSGFIISSGSGWNTVGKGLQNNFAVTLLNLNVAGGSDIIETSAQAQNILQQYTGILTGNINVIVPNTVQIYYVFNNTSGAFALTVKTSGGSGVAVAQGTHAILYCDGTNVLNAFTASVSSTVAISAGSANSPNFNIVGSGSTGIFSPAPNQIAFTAGGYEVMNFVSAASSVNYLQTSANSTGNAPIIAALGSDANIGILLQPKGTGAVGIPKGVILSGTIDGTVIGGVTPAAITGTTITGTTITASLAFVGNVTGNVTGNVSGNAGTVTTISGQISAGTNISITGTGTTGSPYVINSSNTGGTVTSVSMTGDNVIFNSAITGSPITTSGTLIPVLKTQTANFVLAGPVTGVAAAPTFRALVAADIPALTIALSSLATQAANTVVINATAISASPTAVALSTQQVLGRLGGNIVGVGVGTAANNLVQLDASSKLPAVDGSQLTNLATELVLLSTQTAAGSSSLSFTSVISSAYSYYIFVFEDLVSASGTTALLCLMSINNGTSYLSSYDWSTEGFAAIGVSTTTSSGIASDTAICLSLATNSVSSGTANAVCGEMKLFNPLGTNRRKMITSETTSGTGFSYALAVGTNQVTTAVNAIRFQFGSGNISSGKIYCYGVKNT